VSTGRDEPVLISRENGRSKAMRDFTVAIPTGTDKGYMEYMAEQIADAGDNLGMDLSTIDFGIEDIFVMVYAVDAMDAKLRILDCLEETYGTTFDLFPELVK
jgi:hypothetical protein